MAQALVQDVSWQVPFQGKPCYTAFCECDVLLIIQDESLPVADAIPRRSCELTEDDRKKLERLNISPGSGYDDGSIMAARYALDKRFTNVTIKRSNPRCRLIKQQVLQMIKDTMKTSTKPAVIIRYSGPGKRTTGDWCFEDGFITFRDLVECYHECFKGKILGVHSDCSYGGNWVIACIKYLDEQGVKPCAHSAKEKKLFISVDASCKHDEIPYQFLNSIRGNTNDKNTGVLGRWGNGWEVTVDQHIKRVSVTSIECTNKSIDDHCALGPQDTLRKLLYHGRIFIVRGMDNGRPAWHYVLLIDDDKTIERFKELTQGTNAGKHTLRVSDYGQILKSGFGQKPPNEVKEWMEENYGAS